MYPILGLVLSLVGSAIAFTRARAPGTFYASDVYHMTDRSHRRFAWFSAVCALGFAAALRWDAIAVPLLAVYVLFLVLYGSSFARGFSGEDE